VGASPEARPDPSTQVRRGATSAVNRDGSARLPRRTVWLFGLGQSAEGATNHTLTAILLFYYTSVLGLSGTLTGAALMIGLFFDAITDPLVAVFSDRTRSRLGRRHPYMYASALPLGAFLYLALSPPDDLGASLGVEPQLALFAWLLVFVVLTRSAVTLFHVPHMALGAELSDDFDERTRIVTARSLMAVAGASVAVITYFTLVAVFDPHDGSDPRLNPVPYSVYAAICFGLIVLSVLASAWGTRDRIPFLLGPGEDAHRHGFMHVLLRDVREALRIRSFRALFIGFTICFLSFGFTNALGAHAALYFWHISLETQGFYGLALLVGLLTGMAFWKGFSERHDKKPTFLIGLAWFTAFAALPPLAKVFGLFPAEDSPIYVPLFMAAGTGLAFSIASSMVVVGSMMADITDEDELTHSQRREGIFFGALSFATKAASGLGTVLAGIVYDLSGLYRGLDPAQAPESAEFVIGLSTGGITLVLVALSASVFARYDLTRERHAEIRRALDARAVVTATR